MVDSRYDHPGKVYVDVVARFDKNGQLMPMSFIWIDNETYEIDRIEEVCRAASLKAGGAGIRYTVIVGGLRTYMFFEETRWFMETKRRAAEQGG